MGAHIRMEGGLHFNVAFALDLAARSVTHVVLLWDKDTQTLALKPVVGSDPDAYKITYARSKACVYIKRFATTFSIDVPSYWFSWWSEKSQMYEARKLA